MSQHDEERVRLLREDIDQRSAATGESASAEDLAVAAQQRHLEAQGAHVDLSGAPAPDPQFKDPAELFGGVTTEQASDGMDRLQEAIQKIGEATLDICKNPHAMRMVMDSQKTGEPLFCFRARDFFSIQVIAFYARIVEEYGPDDAAFHNNIVDALGEFKEWQKDHITEVRYPD